MTLQCDCARISLLRLKSRFITRFPLDEVICQRKRESNFATVDTVQNVRKGEGKLAKVLFMVSAYIVILTRTIQQHRQLQMQICFAQCNNDSRIGVAVVDQTLPTGVL